MTTHDIILTQRDYSRDSHFHKKLNKCKICFNVLYWYDKTVRVSNCILKMQKPYVLVL